MTNANRTNYVISKAINTSPLARKHHDDHFKTFFNYATKDTSASKVQIGPSAYTMLVAYFKKQKEHSSELGKIVFDPTIGDEIIIPAICHELSHVNQYARAEALNIPVETYQLSFDNYLSLSLITEAQAFTDEIEGPVMGLIGDLAHNKMDNIEFYKKQFSYNESKVTLFKQFKDQFLKGLLGSNNTPMDNTIEKIAYAYFNDLSRLDAMEIEKRQIQGRKNVIEQFFKLDGIQNNIVLDTYVQHAGKHYNSNYDEVVQQMKDNGFSVSRMWADPDKESYLLNIFKMTNDSHSTYLSNDDWFDILKVQDTHELANKALFFSRYKQDAAEHRRRNFVR